MSFIKKYLHHLRQFNADTREPASQKPQDSPPLLSLDITRILRGILYVEGWSLPAENEVQLEFFFEGLSLGQTSCTVEREDVKMVLPDLAGAGCSGFRFITALDGVSPGRIEISRRVNGREELRQTSQIALSDSSECISGKVIDSRYARILLTVFDTCESRCRIAGSFVPRGSNYDSLSSLQLIAEDAFGGRWTHDIQFPYYPLELPDSVFQHVGFYGEMWLPSRPCSFFLSSSLVTGESEIVRLGELSPSCLTISGDNAATTTGSQQPSRSPAVHKKNEGVIDVGKNREPVSQKPQDSPPLSLDAVRIIRGLLYVEGWSLPAENGVQLEFFSEKLSLGQISCTVERGDVKAIFPDLAEAGRFGFRFITALDGASPERIEISRRVNGREDLRQTVQIESAGSPEFLPDKVIDSRYALISLTLFETRGGRCRIAGSFVPRGSNYDSLSSLQLIAEDAFGGRWTHDIQFPYYPLELPDPVFQHVGFYGEMWLPSRPCSFFLSSSLVTGESEIIRLGELSPSCLTVSRDDAAITAGSQQPSWLPAVHEKLAAVPGTGKKTGENAVSIVIRTVSGRAALLDRALSSIAANSYESKEVVIVYQGVDERAVNDIRSVMDNYPDLVVYLLQNKTTEDQRAMNLNLGFHYSTGRYQAILDDDDVYKSDHLQTLVDALSATANVWAYAATSLEVETDGITQQKPFPENPQEHFSFKRLLASNYIPAHTFLVDRMRLPSPDYLVTHPQLCRCEDYYIILRLAFLGEPVFCNKVTSSYSIREDTTQTNIGVVRRLEGQSKGTRDGQWQANELARWHTSEKIIDDLKEQFLQKNYWLKDFLSVQRSVK